jgi:hypothetical protein
MAAYYQPENDDGRGKSSSVTFRCEQGMIAHGDYFHEYLFKCFRGSLNAGIEIHNS